MKSETPKPAVCFTADLWFQTLNVNLGRDDKRLKTNSGDRLRHPQVMGKNRDEIIN